MPHPAAAKPHPCTVSPRRAPHVTAHKQSQLRRLGHALARRGAVALLPLLLLAGVGSALASTAGAPLLRVLTGAASVDSVAVYGPKRFGTPTGGSAYHVERFAILAAPTASYALRVSNGAPDGSARLDSARVVLNGATVYSGADLRSAAGAILSRPVVPQAANSLEVYAYGPAGAYLTLSLVQSPDASYAVFQRLYRRETGEPFTEVVRFNVASTAGAPHKIRIYNGNPDGTERVSSGTVLLNGTYVVVQSDLNQQVGVLEREVTLRPGENVLEVTLQSKPRSHLNFWVTATDNTAPVIQIESPAAGLITRQTEVEAAGRVLDETPTRVTVNGVEAARSGEGFSARVPLAVEGENQLRYTAVDAAGLRTDSVRTVIRDTEPPVITLTAPAEGVLTRDSLLQVRGTITDRTRVTANINGVALTLSPEGAFEAQVPATAEGANFLTVSATDAAGNSSSAARQVTRDTRPPVVAFTAPAEGTLTNRGTMAVEGTVQDESAVAVAVNGVAMQVTDNRTFRGEVPLTVEGRITLAAVATDAAGNEGQAQRGIVRDTTPPVVTVAAPEEGKLTRERAIQVSGTVADSSAVTLTMNGVAVPLAEDRSFTAEAPLAQEGSNALAFVATDAAGNVGRATRTVVRDTTPPVVVIETPAAGLITRQTQTELRGRVTDASPVTLRIGGAEVAVAADGSFATTAALAVEGDNTLVAEATDAAGNAGSASRTVLRDTEAPVVAFAAPAEGARVMGETVQVRGTVQDRTAVTFSINGVTLALDAAGAFAGEVPLGATGTTLSVTATDAAGNVSSPVRTLTRDTEPPVVAFTAPAEGTLTNRGTMAVEGTVQDESAVTVAVNGVAMQVTDNKTFRGEVPLTTEGPVTLTAVATDEVGNKGEATRGIVRDITPPAITVLTPGEGSLTNRAAVEVTGTVRDLSAVTFTLGGAPVALDGSGAFAAPATLGAEGANALAFVAVDAAGNESRAVLGVVRDTEAPVITWTAPAEGLSTEDARTPLAGRVTDASPVTAELGGEPLALAEGGAFAVDAALAVGANSFTITARDAAGNEAVSARAVTRTETPSEPLPPDPAKVAPVLDRTLTTTVGAATEFLYTGENPIQTGVAPGTIDGIRAAGLRGRVLNRELKPLGGVTVTVRDHPEYGQTLTRADGAYDLVVNGGGPVRLDFAKNGYLPAQRQTDAPWQDWVVLDDVILLQLDPVATPVELGSGETQVARASVVEDADGPRQATLVIPAGTTAEYVMPDGTRQPAPALTLRATEFTVGENGPLAMPGALPATTAYTYAVGLTSDGVPAGAEVVLSQPVPLYVENFLDFPVGTPVPTGAWDPRQGAWIPTTDGRVIAIVSTAGGVAGVDVTGDGVADGETVLAELGITVQERQQLAATYRPGAQLQRAPVVRLSGIDLNYPHGVGGVDPTGAAAAECDPSSGIAALCTAQSAAQQVALPGTGVRMAYTSARAPGNEATRTLEIDLTGATLPADLQRVEVVIEVGGRKFTQSFQPTPNLRHSFQWDGKDAYGRPMQGVQPVSVRIGHVYPFLYNVPSAAARSFGLSCQGDPNGGRQACVIPADVDSRARQEATRWQTLSSSLGAYDAKAQAMGGWTLDVHHAYDPVSRLLYRGDGTTRGGTPALKSAVRTAAGVGTGGFAGDGGLAFQARIFGVEDVRLAPNGDAYLADYGNHRIRKIARDGIITTIAGGGTGGDGGPALGARLSFPHGIGFMKDGGLLIAEEGGQRIRRIAPDGTIHTLAGTGVGGYSGDGGPATAAKVNTPRYVLQAADGSIYFTEKTSHVVRRIMPDGTIATVAGTGLAGYAGDGGAAARARLNQPDGLAIGADGSVYVSDQGNHRVRRIDPSGVISTVAGTGAFGFSGDGGQARLAQLNRPQGLEVEADGTLYITDGNNHRVRRVAPSGIITTFAGTSAAGYNGEGGPAADSRFNRPRGITRGPDGALYVADFGNSRVRRVAPAFPGLTGDEMAVAAGTEVYVFDARGRHLRTVGAVTGDTLYQFGYDAKGRVAVVTDGQGRTTQVERDATGRVVAVVGPDGVRSTLGQSASGDLEGVTLPGGIKVGYTYGTGGLITGQTDANGNATQYRYDAQGRLAGEVRPDGSVLSTTRVQGPRGTGVVSTTGTGLGVTLWQGTTATGARQSSVVLPGGQGVVTTTTPDGRSVSTAPDGTVTTLRSMPDPRSGMQAPLTETVTRTPSGLQRTERTGRMVVIDPANNSVMRQTDSVFVNGRVSLESFDRATRQVTRTTAAGRTAVTELDAEGRPFRQTVPGFAPESSVYDAEGRVVERSIGSRTERFTYDAQGRVLSTTDALGRTQSYSYDASGRMVRQTLPGGRQIVYGYDGNGNMTSLTPPARSAHRFGFNAVNQAESYTAPSVGGNAVTASSYSVDGQLNRIVRPDGAVLAMEYDSAGRTKAVQIPGAALAFQYSAQSGVLVGSTRTGGGTLQYQYDGSLLQRAAWSGAVTGEVRYRYDSDFRVAAQIVGGADSVAFRYDADGLLTGAGALVLTRDSLNGLPTGTTLGPVSTRTTYNEYGERSGLEAAYSGSPLFRTRYTRDAGGRIETLTEMVGGVSTTYTYAYDAAGRLTQVSKDGSVSAAYEYDDNGNRTRVTTQAGVVEAAVDGQDRLLSFGEAAYGYTGAGELLYKAVGADTTRYRYDALGNLLEVALPGGTRVEYVVDAENRQVGRKVNGRLVQGFLWEGPLRPVAELDSTGAVVARFVYGERPNVPEYMMRGGRTYRLVQDHLGSVRLVVDVASGEVAQRIDYDAWGEVLQDTRPGFQPFGYAGGLYDGRTGLVRFGARDYDAKTGRWAAKDPLLFEGGESNLYGYVTQDPVNALDPTGQFSMSEITASFSVKNALGAGAFNLSMQIGWNSMSKGEFTLDGIDHSDVIIAAVLGGFAPGIGRIYKTAKRTRGALGALVPQLRNARTANRAAKVAGRISSHKNQLIEVIGTQILFGIATRMAQIAHEELTRGEAPQGPDWTPSLLDDFLGEDGLDY